MTESFDYSDGEVVCRGQMAVPDVSSPRPGIVVFADIGGIGEHSRRWAERIASELGYVALAADFYGEGWTAADMATGIPRLLDWRGDPPRLAVRAAAAVAALAADPRCDGQVAAIGFCFGGSIVLELARQGGADLAAAVSIHGDLTTPQPAAKQIDAKLLVLHGAEDPLVPDAALVAFLREMAAVDADCQTIAYTGAVHGFTNHNADGSTMAGIKYHARTDARAWRAMAAHLAEVFG